MCGGGGEWEREGEGKGGERKVNPNVLDSVSSSSF